MRQLLASLFRVVTGARNALYDRGVLPIYRSPLKVICVGNVVVGGSGKTPLVAELAEWLCEHGEFPVVLSRGYGGTVRGPLVVSRSSSPTEVGDEPLLLVRKGHCPVVIARDRVAGAKFIEEQGLGNIIILDDGYQHRRLHRDLNILSFDLRSQEVRLSVEEDRLLPHGLLRESLAPALLRADFIVGNHRGPKLPKEEVSKFCVLLGRDSLDGEMWIESAEIIHAEQGNPLTVDEASDVVLVTGIARPKGVSDLLIAQGFTVKHHEQLADHQLITPEVVHSLRERFSGLPVICTGKDLARIESQELRDILYVINPRYHLSADILEGVGDLADKDRPERATAHAAL